MTSAQMWDHNRYVNTWKASIFFALFLNQLGKF